MVVLGPVSKEGRLALADRLTGQGMSRTLLYSVVPDQAGPIGTICADGAPDRPVQPACFVPDPLTTRGEARAVSRMAAEHGWHHVILVTSDYHVERSRMIFGRCFHGSLQVVAPSTDLSVKGWVFHSGYQTAGFLKAWLQTGC